MKASIRSKENLHEMCRLENIEIVFKNLPKNVTAFYSSGVIVVNNILPPSEWLDNAYVIFETYCDKKDADIQPGNDLLN